MNNLLSIQMQSHGDMIQVRNALVHLKTMATNWKVDTNYYDMQSIIAFTVNGTSYKLVIPINSSTQTIMYYIKDQLPELLL